jgi:hypothetical protein
MNTILKLENKIKELSTQNKLEISTIETELQKEWFKIFNDLSIIKEYVEKLEKSTDYIVDEFENYPCQYINCKELLDIFDGDNCTSYWEYLSEYLSEYYGYYLDRNHDCMIMNNGPAIIINDEGDILDQDSGKWIINKSDYNNEWYRNILIKNYMKESGYYPGVFYQDYYGNFSLVDTQSEIPEFYLRYLDCCFSDYYQGYSGEFEPIAVPVDNTTTIKELVELLDEYNHCYETPDYYMAFDKAIDKIKKENKDILDKIAFPDIEPCDCDDNCDCESIYAYYVIEQE